MANKRNKLAIPFLLNAVTRINQQLVHGFKFCVRNVNHEACIEFEKPFGKKHIVPQQPITTNNIIHN